VRAVDGASSPGVAPLVDAHVIARRLAISERTVRRLAQQGRIPARKVGPRSWRFDLGEVEAGFARWRAPVTLPGVMSADEFAALLDRQRLR